MANKTALATVQKVEVKDGMFTQALIDKYNERVNHITEVMGNVSKGYISIVGDVKFIETNGLYKQSGYKNMRDFCTDKFGMSKSTMYDLLTVADTLCDPSNDYALYECYEGAPYTSLLVLAHLEAKADRDTLIEQLTEYNKSADNEGKRWQDLAVRDFRQLVMSKLGIAEKSNIGKSAEKPTEGAQDTEKPTEGAQDTEKPTEGAQDTEKPTEGAQDIQKPLLKSDEQALANIVEEFQALIHAGTAFKKSYKVAGMTVNIQATKQKK